MMRIKILSIFPQLLEPFFAESILSRAIQRGLVKIEAIDLRSFTDDRHKVVDDYPYGGGPGMVMKPEPLARAIDALSETGYPRIYLTPQGETFNQNMAEQLAKLPGMLLVCGRYRGIDERIRQHYIDREISLGDFVISGGELAALAVVEAVVRLLPGVLGNEDSVEAESFSQGLLDSPQYTRPEDFEGWKVPEVLLSGNHDRISAWRREQARKRTEERRPDILVNKINHSENS
jgi:tRNA (guanine37-N1)-methyltransferase